MSENTQGVTINNKAPTTIWDALIKLISMAVGLFITTSWIAGFVVAKGFWSTVCCCFPFYAWYLLIEHVALRYNLL